MVIPWSPGDLEAARRGDRGALDALLEYVWPDAYRIAYGVVQDRSLAEDAAQEACATVFNTIGSLRDVNAFRTWLFRIVVRSATAIAKAQPRTITLASYDVAERSQSGEPMDVRNALATLSPPLRVPVILRYYSKCSSSEIARILGIPATTVRFRIAVAKRRLRPLLETRLGPQMSPVSKSEVTR